MRSRAARQPDVPLARDDPDNIGKVFSTSSGALGDIEQAQPPRLMHRRLHGCAADASLRRNGVIRELACAVVLNFTGYDCENGALAFGKEGPLGWGHRG